MAAILDSYVDGIIAKAQRRIAELGGQIAERVYNGDQPNDMYFIGEYLSDGVKSLIDNNDLTDTEKKIIIDRMIDIGELENYSDVPFTFKPLTIIDIGDFTGTGTTNYVTYASKTKNGYITHLATSQVTYTQLNILSAANQLAQGPGYLFSDGVTLSWEPVSGGGISGTGTPGFITKVETDDTGDILTISASGIFEDDTTRTMSNSLDNVVFDYENAIINSKAGSKSIDANLHELYDGNEAISLTFSETERIAWKINGTWSFDWENEKLFKVGATNNGVYSREYVRQPVFGGILYNLSTNALNSDNSDLAINLSARSLHNSSGTATIDFENSILFSSTGNGFFWSTGQLIHSNQTDSISVDTLVDIPTTYLQLSGGIMTGNLNGITPTELTYLSGVTSNVQSQINALNTGLRWKDSARVLCDSNVTIASPGASLDSVAMATNDRVVLNGQSTASQNGIYVWNGAAVAMTRATDSDTSAEILQATIGIQEGTYADQIWMCSTNAPITIGTTALTFISTTASTYTGSNGVSLLGNNFTLDNSYFSGAFTLSAGVATLATVGAAKGGTGVANNAASTWTISGNFGTTVTVTGTTTVTLPTTGTLATLAGSEAFTNKTYNGLTITSSTGTFTLTNGKTVSFANSIAFAGTDSTTITMPASTSTVLANSLGITGGSTLIGGTAVGDKLVFKATSNSTNTVSALLFTFQGNGSSTTPILGFGDLGGAGDNYFHSAQSSATTSNYFLRAGATYSYFNATSDMRFNINASNIIVLSSSSISLRQATTMFTAMTFTLCAGTTSVAPLTWQSSSSLLTTITAHKTEYNGSYYFTNSNLNRYADGGTIADFYVDANNSGTGETDLYSYTTKASTLGANGEKIEALYSGTVNDATATVQFKVYFGGTAILDTTALSLSATGNWIVEVSIIRVSSTVIRYAISFYCSSSTVGTTVASGELTGLTLSNTNILKITGTAGGGGGGSSDITAKMGTIKWWGAAANS